MGPPPGRALAICLELLPRTQAGPLALTGLAVLVPTGLLMPFVTFFVPRGPARAG